MIQHSLFMNRETDLRQWASDPSLHFFWYRGGDNNRALSELFRSTRRVGVLNKLNLFSVVLKYWKWKALWNPIYPKYLLTKHESHSSSHWGAQLWQWCSKAGPPLHDSDSVTSTLSMSACGAFLPWILQSQCSYVSRFPSNTVSVSSCRCPELWLKIRSKNAVSETGTWRAI